MEWDHSVLKAVSHQLEHMCRAQKLISATCRPRTRAFNPSIHVA